jgi:hypothetical protein
MSEHPREPIPHTCPDIDKIVKLCKNIKSTGKLGRYEYTIEELTDIIDNMTSDADDIEDLVEKIRYSNDELRRWGNDEATRVDELELELEDIEKQTNL